MERACWPWRQSSNTPHTVWIINAGKLVCSRGPDIHAARGVQRCEGMLHLAGGRTNSVQFKQKREISEKKIALEHMILNRRIGRRRGEGGEFCQVGLGLPGDPGSILIDRSGQVCTWLVLCKRHLMDRCRRGGNTKQHRGGWP